MFGILVTPVSLGLGRGNQSLPHQEAQSASWAQQRLDGAALVHRVVALRYLIKRQGQVEHLAGVDFSVPHPVNQFGKVAAYRGGATVEVDVSEEELLAIELDPVRDADLAHGAAPARGTDRLHHRLLRTDTLQYRVRTDSVGQLLDAGHALVAAPLPTIATVEPGFTFAASAANQPVPMISESVSRLGIRSSEGTSGVATSVPSARGMQSTLA
jgi:hypothetical protein